MLQIVPHRLNGLVYLNDKPRFMVPTPRLQDDACQYLFHRCRQCVALCPSNLYLGKLAELNDGLGEIQYVVAALKEAVQAHKESVVLGAQYGAMVEKHSQV